MFKLQELKSKLSELGIVPRKSKGQNFLINSDAIGKIIKAVKPYDNHSLIEAGPGLGALTEPLIQLGRPLALLEFDSKLASYWKEKNQNVIETDALKYDWKNINVPDPKLFVSNLPYQISSSIVIERSINPCGVQVMVLMFQKEVAQRMMAKSNTKDYGLLTVIAQSFWAIDKVFEISSKDFYPPPAVASRVLSFKRIEENKTKGLDEKFLAFVKQAFSKRRKMMMKILSEKYPADKLKASYKSLNLDLKARAESLTVEQFQALFLKIV